MVNWTLRNKFQWHVLSKYKIFIHENASEKIVCKKVVSWHPIFRPYGDGWVRLPTLRDIGNILYSLRTFFINIIVHMRSWAFRLMANIGDRISPFFTPCVVSSSSNVIWPICGVILYMNRISRVIMDHFPFRSLWLSTHGKYNWTNKA